MNDTELKRAVETMLHGEVRLRGRGIRVAVEGDRVDLTGEVAGLAEKRLATNLVRRMAMVGEVRDQLRLPTAHELSDRQIAQHVQDAWAHDGALRRRTFTVTVEDGVVTIAGTTDNLEEKRLAGVLAWWVPGVADVDNRIAVEPHQEGTEADLIDSVRQVFEKDVLINPDLVGVMARGTTVILVGTVTSHELRMAAEHDCYYIWGVEDVDNRLVVTAM